MSEEQRTSLVEHLESLELQMGILNKEMNEVKKELGWNIN